MTTLRTEPAMSAERKALNREIANCRDCPGLNVPGVTGSAPGFGSESAPVMLVGQSLCKVCMDDPPEPFRGGCGWLIDDAIDRARRVKTDLFITNVVHCHPNNPDDRPSTEREKANCRRFLRGELSLVQPRLVVGLGKDAREALRDEYRGAPELGWEPFTPPAALPATGPVLLLLDHPNHVRRWYRAERREQWIDALTTAIRWGFSAR